MRKLLLAAAGLLMVTPFLYMISLSLMGEGELLRWPPPLVPAVPTFDNYAEVLNVLGYGRVMLNTAVLAGCVMVGQILTSAAAGYALARLEFPGRQGTLTTLLIVLAFPTIVLLIPRFLMMQALGWIDTYPGLISTELVSVWGILLMRQTFVMLPRDIEDAARLDGAGEWTVFWHVTLPLARPAVAALAVLAFLDQWRNVLWPLAVTESPTMEVAEVALARFHIAYAGNWPYQMAAAMLITAPLLIVCLLAQRHIMAGIRFTGADLRF